MSEKAEIKVHPPKPQGQNGEPLFDDRVKIVNEKTGAIVAYQPFSLHVFGDNKDELRERPPGSGNMYDRSGREIGNWQPSKEKPGAWEKVSDKHVFVRPTPINERDQLAQDLEAAKEELAALKAEKELKQANQKESRKRE